MFLLAILRRMLSWFLIQRHFRGPPPRRPGEVLESGASKVIQVFLDDVVKFARSVIRCVFRLEHGKASQLGFQEP